MFPRGDACGILTQITRAATANTITSLHSQSPVTAALRWKTTTKKRDRQAATMLTWHSVHSNVPLCAEPEEKNPYLHPVLVIQSDPDARSTTDQKHKRNTSYSNNNNNKRGLCPYMQTFTRLSLNIITSKQQQIQKHIFFAIMLQFNLLCNMCG